MSRTFSAIRTVLFLLSTLCVVSRSHAQGSAGTNATLESRMLIDLPTAGIIPSSALAFDAEFFESGGFLAGFSVGVLDRLIFGLTYGGTDIVGGGSPDWNPIPGFQFRGRIVEESEGFPAIVLGFNSQGKGPYVDDAKRYAIKSPGIYLTGSKNYSAWGYLGIHAGVNYSFENEDGDKDMDFFASAEKTIGPFFSLLAEYDLSSNDNSGESFGRGRGYLNIGGRFSLGNGVSLAFAFKDLLDNGLGETAGNRVIQLEYVNLP